MIKLEFGVEYPIRIKRTMCLAKSHIKRKKDADIEFVVVNVIKFAKQLTLSHGKDFWLVRGQIKFPYC